MAILYVGACSCGATKTTRYRGRFVVWVVKHIAKGHEVVESKKSAVKRRN